MIETLNLLVGQADDYYTRLSEILQEIEDTLRPLAEHVANGDNPHQVSKRQVGLGQVVNLPVATPSQARNARFNMGYMTPLLTHHAIDTKVNKDYIGLGAVQNHPVATVSQAQVGSSNEAYMTPLRTQQNFEENTKHMQGEAGSLMFASSHRKAMEFVPGLMVLRNPALVEGATEMNLLKGYIESFEQVFDDWHRISHSGENQPADAGELTGWNYNASNDTVNSTINSTTLIGLISPERHTDFVFDVTVKSTNNDDDLIGVCFGFVTEEGRECTLTAMRTPGGAISGSQSGKLFNVVYNYRQPDALDLGSTNGGLKWGDGVVDDTRDLGTDINAVIDDTGWSHWPDGCRIRVERFGDVFTLRTSDLGSETFKESATIVVDINDYPELEKFRGPIQFGYVCYSQSESTWEVHRRPVELGTVTDANTFETWEWDGGQFVLSDEQTAKERLLPNRLFYNEMTGKLYYNEPFRGLMKISG